MSATVTLSKKVSLAELLGFEEYTMDILPFQKHENQLIVLPEELSATLLERPIELADYLAALLKKLRPLNQPILVLFTSTATLLQVSDSLSERGIVHLAQHKDGQDMSLKRRFERGECQLLLAGGSFWEGVDLAETEGMIQIITRLPFENPKDSFVKKVNRSLKQAGKNPFYDYSLPMMMIKLRQAIGRSRRHEQQKGAILILDPRLSSKQYGKQVLSFLKRDYLTSQLPESVWLDTLQSFFED